MGEQTPVLPLGLGAPAEEAEEVRAFCAEHELGSELALVVGLVLQWFPAAEGLSACVREDPEEGARWVVVRFRVIATPEDAFEAYKRLTVSFVERVPAAKRELVRISYAVNA